MVRKIVYSADGLEAYVYCDTCCYHITAAEARRFQIGAELTEEDRELLEYGEQKLKCIKSALSRIAYSDITRKALYRKLKTKFSSAVCEEAVTLMAEKGYLDDLRFCRKTVETLYRVRLYGRRKIKAKLFADGFETETVKTVFDEFEFDSDFENIQKLLIKKYGNAVRVKSRQEKAKMCAYLYSAGYNYDEINKALSIFAEDYDEQ